MHAGSLNSYGTKWTLKIIAVLENKNELQIRLQQLLLLMILDGLRKWELKGAFYDTFANALTHYMEAFESWPKGYSQNCYRFPYTLRLSSADSSVFLAL